MRQILNMWRFVKLVDQDIQESDKVAPVPFQLVGYKGWHPTTINIKQKYMAKYKGTTHAQVDGICVDTLKGEYLEPITDKKGQIPIDTLCITTKGRKLIDGWRFLPMGLFKAWVDEYGATVTMLVGLPTAVGLGVAIHYTVHWAKILFHHL